MYLLPLLDFLNTEEWVMQTNRSAKAKVWFEKPLFPP